MIVKMWIISVLLIGFCVCAKGQIAVFDLSLYNPDNRTTEVQKTFVNLTEGLSEILVNNIPDSVGFFIIQVHSYPDNVSLSSTYKMKRKKTVNGMNVGLLSFNKNDSIFYVKTKTTTIALVAITVYTEQDPIPGGCNLSFDTLYAPYQLVSYTDDLIIVESQAPSAFDTTCDKNNVHIDMYHLFLHENDYSSSYYFNGIQNMLTADSIKANGYQISTLDGYFKYRHLYNSYRGVGQVFAIVATYHNRSSAYVPAVSYGCDLNDLEKSCTPSLTRTWSFICAIFLIFGLFINFYGHKFFRSTLYLAGFAVGVFVMYIILSVTDNNITVGERATVSVLAGLTYGACWLLIWWKFGSPLVSVSLTFLLGGFLMASIIFYAGVADMKPFRNNINFWITFASVIIFFQTLWTMRTLEGHIFACSFLGSYAFVTALNYYTGGNLQYIMINSFRRIVIKDFSKATIDPPFQILDISQSILWVILTTFGFYYQMKEQRTRPPFPSHRLAPVEEGVSETTPLIRSSGVIYSDI